ncbi:MAG: metallophosphoesterase [Deltaproteobacteria bacterium]|nr:metallophosphoesterase [Deltaproteobacteria bacterium]
MFKKKGFLYALLMAGVLLCIPLLAQARFSFVVASDQRKYSGQGKYNSASYFRGVVEAIHRQGEGAFLISAGDIDPPVDSRWTISQVLGVNYPWYPAVGNHELPGEGSEDDYGSNMEWLRGYDYDANGPGTPPNLVNTGPSGCPQTTYSFDYDNAHFVVINVYCDTGGDHETNGDIPDHLYNWLENDLAATDRAHIFVFGHEPAFPQPDADNGRTRHMDDALNAHPENRDRFWNLLKNAGVVAYICGHTHSYSAVRLDGLWQVDSGHARGKGDTGTPSTFLVIHVDGGIVRLKACRDTHDGVYDYLDLIHTLTLRPGTTPRMPALVDIRPPEVGPASPQVPLIALFRVVPGEEGISAGFRKGRGMYGFSRNKPALELLMAATISP